ncbi:hypothetical protein [Streptomyces sp. NPDC101206]|uniref:hypothetical protein n=1 Tax=Streptomyces sp. NPDC101206 TaxID=3366128 RepID=UPI003802E897
MGTAMGPDAPGTAKIRADLRLDLHSAGHGGAVPFRAAGHRAGRLPQAAGTAVEDSGVEPSPRLQR